MRKWILLLPFVLIACAEKGTQNTPPVINAPQELVKIPSLRPEPTTPVQLVFDTKYEGVKPINYRKNDRLHMSGSASFSPRALKDIAKSAKKSKIPFYVFDLRQESHGYINDKPVTWQSEHDWANADLMHDEVIQRERRLLGDLRVGEQIDGTYIKSIETEESVVRSAGHQYVRLTVTDHLRPTDSETDRFIQAVRELPEKNWVHFHCRAGKGRTTTFMVMYDMLANAQTDSFDDIINRNAKLSEDYDVMAEVPESDFRHIYQKDRAEFVRAFYDYAKAHPHGKDKVWSQWSRK